MTDDTVDVWVTTGATESGDTIGPYVWMREPSDQEVDELVEECFPDDFESGLVYYGTDKIKASK